VVRSILDDRSNLCVKVIELVALIVVHGCNNFICERNSIKFGEIIHKNIRKLIAVEYLQLLKNYLKVNLTRFSRRFTRL